MRNEKLEMRNCGMRFAHESINIVRSEELQCYIDIFIIIYNRMW